ncbi:MAG: hypothetical protein C4320_01125, partial [Armatimonadota bacterium]
MLWRVLLRMASLPSTSGKARRRILVAMSGGVDSSVAAAIMVREGHEVIGLTMQIWQESQNDARHAG